MNKLNYTSRIVMLAGTLGNGLEWLDFVLYAYFAPVLAKLFFPLQNQYLSLLITFSVFAGGFLVRPIGALILGSLADKLGRKKILVFSISLISTTSFFIAILPTYYQIGILSPILLIVIRLLQGFGVSGELNGAAAFLIEHAHIRRRGLAGSLVMCSAYVGVFLGSFMVTVASLSFTPSNLLSYGWRVPFLVASIIGVFVIYLRLKAEESPYFIRVKANNEISNNSISRMLFGHWKLLIITICITCSMAVCDYLFVGYFTTFLTNIEGFSLKVAALINFCALIILIILLPIYGILSDIFGRKIVFKCGLIGLGVFAYPIFLLLAQKSWVYVLCGEVLFTFIYAAVGGVLPTILAELYPTTIRNSGTSFGYNIAQALFGGTAPIVAFTLVHVTGSVIAPAMYMVACILVSLCALFFVKESYNNQLL